MGIKTILVGMFSILFLLSSATSQPLLIEELYPNTRLQYEGDEFIKLKNPANYTVNLSGWTISDSEGELYFPSYLLEPGQIIYIAREAAAFKGTMLLDANFELADTDAKVPEIRTNGYFRLANKGDRVALFDVEGKIVDAVAYGNVSSFEGWSGEPLEKPKSGQIFVRSDESNTDTKNDWISPRKYLAGQSRFEYASLSMSGNVTIFVSPDSSYESVTNFIDSARASLYISLYEFNNFQIAERVTNASKRGVKVMVFLDGSPVGGITKSELQVVDMLTNAGVEVRILKSPRYRFFHEKYAVADNSSVLITTENWKNDSIPEINTHGNRGWGIILENSSVAGYYNRIFFDDWTMRTEDEKMTGSTPAQQTSPEGAMYGTYIPKFQAKKFYGTFNITPVLAPDMSLDNRTLLEMIKSAKEYVYVEQFYIYPKWGNSKNLYLEAAIEAARRGVEVKILLDSYYYNIEVDDPKSNVHTVEYVNGIAKNEGLALEAKLIDLDAAGLVKLHTKGVVADNKTLVSSINWNENSPTYNREIGIIIDSPEVANYFKEVFLQDWHAKKAMDLGWVWWVVIILCAIICAVYAHGRHRKKTGKKPQITIFGWTPNMEI
jgi:phosphatidylserine/phosphatidylglycerophosphate/cardiolipin synthase-like enzyme